MQQGMTVCSMQQHRGIGLGPCHSMQPIYSLYTAYIQPIYSVALALGVCSVGLRVEGDSTVLTQSMLTQCMRTQCMRPTSLPPTRRTGALCTPLGSDARAQVVGIRVARIPEWFLLSLVAPGTGRSFTLPRLCLARLSPLPIQVLEPLLGVPSLIQAAACLDFTVHSETN